MFSVLENQYQYPFSFLRLYQVFEIKRRTVRILLPYQAERRLLCSLICKTLECASRRPACEKASPRWPLAAILDVNPQYISRIERGVNACSLGFLSALAHAWM